MDRNLARKNVRSGLIVAAVCFFMFGMTFVGRPFTSHDSAHCSTALAPLPSACPR